MTRHVRQGSVEPVQSTDLPVAWRRLDKTLRLYTKEKGVFDEETCRAREEMLECVRQWSVELEEETWGELETNVWKYGYYVPITEFRSRLKKNMGHKDMYEKVSGISGIWLDSAGVL